MISEETLSALSTPPNRGPHGYRIRLGNGARLGGPGSSIVFATMATYQQRWPVAFRNHPTNPTLALPPHS